MDCYLIDAFSAGPFTGNPAAVCLLQRERTAAWMQALAAELNQSETAFVHGVGADWNLRWFTPRVEVDLCGHATLAAAHVLWSSGLTEAAQLHFASRSGILTCARREDGRITLSLPRIDMTTTTAPDDLDVILGARLLGVWRAAADLVVELDDAACVRGLRPDLTALAALDLRGIAVTAAGDDGIHDCVSRFFAPRVGINEDAVTGSVHAAIGPMWAKRLGRNTIAAFQASARGGRLDLDISPAAVTLCGRCETIFTGKIVAA